MALRIAARDAVLLFSAAARVLGVLVYQGKRRLAGDSRYITLAIREDTVR